MSYEKIDLNLFMLFETLMKQRSVSAAARELGVTPSAVSHGLARLRKLLGNDLFIAGPAGMQPTPKARELAPDISDGLSKLAVALENRPFDPAETSRTFVIAGSDYVSTLILPAVMSIVARAAPHVQIRLFPLGRLDAVQQLDEDGLQVVIGWFGMLPDRIDRETLLIEHEAVVVRAGHPLTKMAVSQANILRYKHIVVELTGSVGTGESGFVDDRGVMRRVWIERLLIETVGQNEDAVGQVAVTVPHYFDVPPLLKNTDMVATLPRRLALLAAARDGLVVLDLPYKPLVVRQEMIWHKRANKDAGLSWLLQQIKEAVKAI